MRSLDSRRYAAAWLLTAGLVAGALIGCEETPDSTVAPAIPGERSAEENEPPPPQPTAQTGALGAAALERAIRIHEEDPAGARRLLEQGCDQGTVRSCLALADLLESEGTEQALREAGALVEQACAEGSTEACDRLGH